MPDYIKWLRSKIGTRKVPLVFACAIVRDEQGRVLWQQRGDFGWWGLPGGVLELDESLTECLLREVLEETGLTVELLRLTGIYSSPDFDVRYPNGDEAQQVTFTYECRVSAGHLQKDGQETLSLAWHAPEELPPTSPWYRAMIDDLERQDSAPQFTHGTASNGIDSVPLHQSIRQFIGQAPYVAAGTAAIICDPQGRVLLQRRGDNGKWDLPGGALELGERIDTAVIREVYEETGLEVKVERISGVYSDQRFFVTYPNGDQMKVIAVIFVCSIIGGQLQADGVESLELAFFSPKDLPPISARSLQIINDALAENPQVVLS